MASKATVSTPTRKPNPAPVTDSPGHWRHPRLSEITRRQEASTFGEKNVKRIVYNIVVFFALVIGNQLLRRLLPASFVRRPPAYYTYTYYALLVIPLVNICLALLPIWRKDDFSDIPLTPGQRKLLGLPASSTPATPGSVYSTPPRYAASPSIGGSAGSRRSFSTSPLSGSPLNNSNTNLGSPFSPAGRGSPLLQKATNGARRSSLGSLGPPSPMGGSVFGASSSIFGGQDGPGTPSPTGAKRSTVGLNNKWLYERGRRTSGMMT